LALSMPFTSSIISCLLIGFAPLVVAVLFLVL
jgi:hypothetical protein